MNGRLLKFLNPRLGAFSSFISMIIGVGLIFVSMGIFPGYNILNNWVSDLGAGSGVRPFVFGCGLVLSGYIAIPFFLSLGKNLIQEGGNEKLVKTATFFGIMACAGLTIAGYFPSNPGTLILHGIGALIFFFSGLIFCILYSVAGVKMRKQEKERTALGFVVAVMFALFLSTLIALTEWLVFFSIVSWVVLQGFMLLKRGNN